MPPPEESASAGSAPRSISFTSQFPIPSPMTLKGDLVNNWEFFKQQWSDYEVATGLDKPRTKGSVRHFWLRYGQGMFTDLSKP